MYVSHADPEYWCSSALTAVAEAAEVMEGVMMAYVHVIHAHTSSFVLVSDFEEHVTCEGELAA